MATAPKSRDAFRTISEVAEWLQTPAHVLRFWESKFSQVKPVKRAGGRRYYRPADMELLGGIKKLLHEDGMTIKGVQKLLREQGVRYVASLSPNTVDGTLAGTMDDDAPFTEAEAAETVVPFARSTPPRTDPAAGEATADDLAAELATEEGPAPADTAMEDAPAADLPEAPEIAASAAPLGDDAGLAADAARDVAQPEEEVAMSGADSLIEDDNDPGLPLFDNDEAPAAEATVPEAPQAAAEAPAAERAPLVAREPDAIDPRPGTLSRIARLDRLSPDQARRLSAQISALRRRADRMSAARD